MRAAARAVILVVVAGCGGAAVAPVTGGGGGGVGNHDDHAGPALSEQMTEAQFRDVLATGAFKRVELDSVDFDPLGAPVAGRVMARGDRQLTVEGCGWPRVEFYADASGELYAVEAGHAEGIDVGLFEKRMPPRCGAFIFDLPAGLHFGFKVELTEVDQGDPEVEFE